MSDNIFVRKNNNEIQTQSIISADVYSLKNENSEKCRDLFQFY